MSRRRRLSPLALALPLLLTLGACASDAPQDTLQPQGPIARDIDNLFMPVIAVAAVVFVIVEVGVLALLVRFRRRKDDDGSLPTQTHGNTRLEIGWTVLPAMVLAAVAVGTVATLFRIEGLEDDGVTIQVEGQQWWWQYGYDVDGDGETDMVTANDMIIPAGQNVSLEITSNDVIHSFWIPALNGKKDAVPGRTHPLTLNADEPGTYVGQCTEFCGLSHAYMRQRVIALPEDEFEAWLEDQMEDAERPADGDAALGADLFVASCSRCHLVRGVNDAEFDEEGGRTLVAGNGPDLTHFASRGAFAGATFDLWNDQDGDGIVEADEIGQDLNRADLEAWLRDPPGQKPMAPEARGMPNLQLQEEQIDQLVAFLETLD